VPNSQLYSAAQSRDQAAPIVCRDGIKQLHCPGNGTPGACPRERQPIARPVVDQRGRRVPSWRGVRAARHRDSLNRCFRGWR
jgi:hypothetical protein